MFMVSCVTTFPDANAADTDVNEIAPGLVRFGIKGGSLYRIHSGSAGHNGRCLLIEPLQSESISWQVDCKELPVRKAVDDHPVDPSNVDAFVVGVERDGEGGLGVEGSVEQSKGDLRPFLREDLDESSGFCR
jgi:hypothetical protein